MATCYICTKELRDESFSLCKDHAKELYDMLNNKQNIVVDPDWRYHCLICGEFEHRRIIDYPSAGPFCDKDIKKEWERNSKDEISEDAE